MMKSKSKTSAIIWGIFCILSLLLLISGIVKMDSGSILVSIISLSIFLPFLLLYIKMIGKTYFKNNEIIKEVFGKNIVNSVNKNLKIKFGTFSIKFINQYKQYLDRENDEGNVIEYIYRYVENNIKGENIKFPITYKNDNYIIIIFGIFFGIAGLVLFIFLILSSVEIYINIIVLLFSLVTIFSSFFVYFRNRKITFEKDKIIICRILKKDIVIPINDIRRIELLNVFKKLAMYFYYKNKENYKIMKNHIELNKNTNYNDIENMYLLNEYYNANNKQ